MPVSIRKRTFLPVLATALLAVSLTPALAAPGNNQALQVEQEGYFPAQGGPAKQDVQEVSGPTKLVQGRLIMNDSSAKELFTNKYAYRMDTIAPIVGGDTAQIEEVPWQVALAEKGTWAQYYRQFCGGSIISSTWVVTAAHCVAPFSGGTVDTMTSVHRKIVVVSGTAQLSEKEEKPLGIETGVKAILIHPEYDDENSNNDLALIELESPLEFGPTQSPILLPAFQNWPANGTDAIVSGWGNISANGDVYPSSLRKAELKVIGSPNSKFCGKYPAELGSYQNRTMLCAGIPELGGVDTCQGDSGGPLAVLVNGSPYLAGITSWGNGCARPHYPGIYTRVTTYTDWIAKTMNATLGALRITATNEEALAEDSPLCAEVYNATNINTGPVASDCADYGEKTVQVSNLLPGKYKVSLEAVKEEPPSVPDPYMISGWWTGSGPTEDRKKAGLVTVVAEQTKSLSLQMDTGGMITVNVGEVEPSGGWSFLCFYAVKVGSDESPWHTCRNPVPRKQALIRLPEGNYHIFVQDESGNDVFPTQWHQGRTERSKATAIRVKDRQNTEVKMLVGNLLAPPWKVRDLRHGGFTSGTSKSTLVSWRVPSDSGSARVSGYEITIKNQGQVVRISEQAGTSLTVRDLLSGKKYRVEVRAKNKWGYGPTVSLFLKVPR